MKNLLSSLPFSWLEILKNEFTKPYFIQLSAFIEQEIGNDQVVYPPRELIFNALIKTPYEKVKVVILGQDPYHGSGQAHGLCFSVPNGTPLPPSLKNIFKELHSDLGVPKAENGDLTRWTEQGILLLNSILTVTQGKPLSHAKQGWEYFTDTIIQSLLLKRDPVIFVLWGKSAQEKCRFLEDLPEKNRHFFLTAPHPSPFSAYQGFFGCRHFSKINNLLISQGEKPIRW